MISFYGGNGSLAECRLLARNPLKSCPAAIGAAHQPRAWPVVGGLLPFNLGRLQSPFGRLLNGGFWPTIG
jgi:hypothetical protein